MVQFCYLRLYLGTKTIFFRLFSTNDKDGHGLKLEKVEATFSSSKFNACKNHSPKKIIMISAP